jgi:hypothetical protein
MSEMTDNEKTSLISPWTDTLAIMRHKLTSGRYGLNATDIGQMIETDNVQKGILLAPEFQHVNSQGKRVGPVLDYFVAPKDTRRLCLFNQMSSYDDDIKLIAEMKSVSGHGGILLPDDTAIYNTAATNADKLALWHMPTLALVNGQNAHGKVVNTDNMYAHKDKGALKGTFTDKVRRGLHRWCR